MLKRNDLVNESLETELILRNMADGTPNDGEAGGTDDQVSGEQAESTETQPDTFTQADVDRIVAERLKREKEKREKAEQEAALKEQGKYKELLDEKERELNALKEQIASQEMDALKTSVMVEAGYAPEQFEFVKRNLTGETAEELKESVKTVLEFIKPKSAEPDYVDPVSKGNGIKNPPKQADNVDAGRNIAKGILGKRKR